MNATDRLEEQIRSRQDLYILLSLLLLILIHPVLDHGRVPRLILGISTFAPLLFATIRMAQIKGLIWPFIIVVASAIVAATRRRPQFVLTHGAWDRGGASSGISDQVGEDPVETSEFPGGI